MCTLLYFEHKTCKHVWAVIATPCEPLMGFSTCPSFGDGSVKPTPKYLKTRTRPCPRCQLGGVYDRNQTRMVEGMGWGVKWGVGPRSEDYGCEVTFPGGCVVL